MVDEMHPYAPLVYMSFVASVASPHDDFGCIDVLYSLDLMYCDLMQHNAWPRQVEEIGTS